MDHAKQIDDLAEALASTQAEHATWMEQYDSVVRYGNELLAKNDTAQAQLAESAHLLERATSVVETEPLASDILGFLSKHEDRHAQAEQQEAQDSQLDKDARIALLERELDRERERADMAEVELQHARAALATQPAEWIDPCPLTGVGKYYDQGFADGVAEAKRLNAVRGAEHGQ